MKTEEGRSVITGESARIIESYVHKAPHGGWTWRVFFEIQRDFTRHEIRVEPISDVWFGSRGDAEHAMDWALGHIKRC